MSTRNLVETFLQTGLDSLNTRLNEFCADDLLFQSPLANTKGLPEFSNFLQDIRWKFSELQLKKIFEDGNDICAIYTKRSNDPNVGELTFTDLFQMKDGKIQSIESNFNAKPLLDSWTQI